MGAADPPFARWVLRPEPHDDAPLRLICIPYAGGGPAAYHGWADRLGPGVDTWLLRLPGRDSRLREPPRTSVADIVSEAAAVCADELREPFGVFGYSVGAFIGFELVRELRRSHGLRAAHLGVAARCAPHVPMRHTPVHRLPDDQFLDAVDRRFNAVPAVIRDTPQMRALYLPILRADTTVLETYRYRPGPPLDCPISAFGGASDIDCPEDGLRAWQEHTSGGFRLRMLPGGHFFLQPQRRQLLDALATDLLGALVP